MENLIHDLLSYSRVGSKEKPLSKTNLTDVLIDVRKNLELRVHQTGAQIDFEQLPTLFADKMQMIQLFQNLLGNAIKFNESPVPKVEIGVNKHDKKHVELFVKDNGIGFKNEFSDHVFTIFQRLHTQEKYEGTGIGLAICRKIVDRHRGEIWVDSSPGKGSVFYIRLPNRNNNHG